MQKINPWQPITAEMELCEQEFETPIRVLLQGSVRQLAKKLHKNKSTISRWQKRLGLVGEKYCVHHQSHYDSSACPKCVKAALDEAKA